MDSQQALDRVQRVLMLDDRVFVEIRDDDTFTPVSAAAAFIAVLLAGIGAWLYGEFVLDFTPEGWFTDTVILGSLFTIILFATGAVLIYVMLTQVFRADIPPDALARVVLIAHIPYALGLLVFISEIGFAFGMVSVLATFYYTIHALLAAFPRVSPAAAMVSVLVGFAVWLLIIPVISDPGDHFVTGVFVYSLFA